MPVVRLQCILCGKIIECSKDNTLELINHIKNNHSDINILISEMGSGEDVVQNGTRVENAEGDRGQPSTSTKLLYTRKYKVVNPIRARTPGRRKMYKTSIEKWRPGVGVICCPKCGAKKRPLIQSKTAKVSTSPFGSACILTCWPFCFLPCLFPPPTSEYLYCAACKAYLGLYDKKKECIRPNREFVEPVVEAGGCSEENNNTSLKVEVENVQKQL